MLVHSGANIPEGFSCEPTCRRFYAACGGMPVSPPPRLTQAAVLPLVLNFDTLRWVLNRVALPGIGVTIYARIDDWKRRR
jgi:hypothetical protein